MYSNCAGLCYFFTYYFRFIRSLDTNIGSFVHFNDVPHVDGSCDASSITDIDCFDHPHGLGFDCLSFDDDFNDDGLWGICTFEFLDIVVSLGLRFV